MIVKLFLYIIHLVDNMHYSSRIKQNGKILTMVTENSTGWILNLYEAEELKSIPLKETVSGSWGRIEYGSEGESFEFTEDCRFLYMGTPNGLLRVLKIHY